MSPIYRALIFDLDGTLIDSEIDFHEMKKRSIRLLEISGVESGLLTEEMLNYEIEELATKELEIGGLTPAGIRRILQKVAKIMDEIELAALDGASIFEACMHNEIKRYREQQLQQRQQ